MVPWWAYPLMGATAIGGGFVAVVTAVNQSLGDHDWRTCTCGGCKERRLRAWNKQRAHLYRKPVLRPGGSGFISTMELRAGMRVMADDQWYRVLSTEVDRVNRVIHVGLENDKSKTRFVMDVKFVQANNPYWKA